MGSRERRDREKAETRQRILDAARDMFVQQGYAATTMRAIADRVEYTPTAIYHHFRNKEALLEELCSVDFGHLAADFQRIGRLADPVERLVRLGDAYVQFAIDHPMHYRFMFIIERPEGGANECHGSKDPAQDAYGFLRESCVEVIERGLLHPDYRDPDELAQILWSALHGIVSVHMMHEHENWIELRDLKSTAARICQLLLRGLTQPSH